MCTPLARWFTRWVSNRGTQRCSHGAQIFIGRHPSYGHGKDTAVVTTVITPGRRPPCPYHPQLSNQLWEMFENCWSTDPPERATVEEVLKFLENRWGMDPSERATIEEVF